MYIKANLIIRIMEHPTPSGKTLLDNYSLRLIIDIETYQANEAKFVEPGAKLRSRDVAKCNAGSKTNPSRYLRMS